ncbi:MAG: hypothetical protein WA354_00895, partial [Terracidiphilus sp.]
MKRFFSRLYFLLRRARELREGATAVEYLLAAMMLALASVAGGHLLATSIGKAFSQIAATANQSFGTTLAN